MPKICTICSSPKRATADKMLTQGKTLREITGKTGFKRAALQRHKDHIKTAILRARENGIVGQGKTIVEQFTEMWEQAIAEYDKAKSTTDKALWFRERRGLFELGAKLGMQRRNQETEYYGCDQAILEMWDRFHDRS